MKTGLIRLLALAAMTITVPLSACAEPTTVSPAVLPEGPPPYSAGQLDQLLAPIALYPDPLLTQILTAATYPLEVVEAVRWVQDPRNAKLKGDELASALQTLDWDPSVKSLVPFPQVLKMMDSQLEWTQKLGDAFLAQPSDVMDAVQRLRKEAQSAGKLVTTPQETVTTEQEAIVIEPASPEIAYVPCYNPAIVYGVWPYPAYPPYYYAFPECYPGIVFGFGIAIVEPLWGWEWWEWRHHRIHRDHHKWNEIDRYNIDHRRHPRQTGDSWEHDPYHRRGVAYPTLETRERFLAPQARRPEAGREFRGFEQPPAPQARGAITPSAPPHGAVAPSPAAPHATAPVFESFGTPRSDVRAHEARGRESRGLMAPSRAPSGAAPSRAAPSGAGPRGGHPGGGHGGGPSGGPRN
jgi:hypothetical protein